MGEQVQLLVPLLRTLGDVAPSAECRAQLLTSDCGSLLTDVVRCLHFQQLPHVCEASLVAIGRMCVEPSAQVVYPGQTLHFL